MLEYLRQGDHVKFCQDLQALYPVGSRRTPKQLGELSALLREAIARQDSKALLWLLRHGADIFYVAGGVPKPELRHIPLVSLAEDWYGDLLKGLQGNLVEEETWLMVGGPPEERAPFQPKLAEQKVFEMGKFDHVAVGKHHMVASVGAEVFVSGSDGRCGRLGLGTTLGPHKCVGKGHVQIGFKRAFTAGSPVTQIACGDSHTAIVLESGELYVWGDNTRRQLGLPGQAGEHCYSRPTELVPRGRARIAKAVAGANHTLLLDVHGHVMAFGDNRAKQCGVDIGAFVPDPRPVTFDVDSDGATLIAARADISGAYLPSVAALFVWGDGLDPLRVAAAPQKVKVDADWHTSSAKRTMPVLIDFCFAGTDGRWVLCVDFGGGVHIASVKSGRGCTAYPVPQLDSGVTRVAGLPSCGFALHRSGCVFGIGLLGDPLSRAPRFQLLNRLSTAALTVWPLSFAAQVSRVHTSDSNLIVAAKTRKLDWVGLFERFASLRGQGLPPRHCDAVTARAVDWVEAQFPWTVAAEEDVDFDEVRTYLARAEFLPHEAVAIYFGGRRGAATLKLQLELALAERLRIGKALLDAKVAVGGEFILTAFTLFVVLNLPRLASVRPNGAEALCRDKHLERLHCSIMLALDILTQSTPCRPLWLTLALAKTVPTRAIDTHTQDPIDDLLLLINRPDLGHPDAETRKQILAHARNPKLHWKQKVYGFQVPQDEDTQSPNTNFSPNTPQDEDDDDEDDDDEDDDDDDDDDEDDDDDDDHLHNYMDDSGDAVDHPPSPFGTSSDNAENDVEQLSIKSHIPILQPATSARAATGAQPATSAQPVQAGRPALSEDSSDESDEEDLEESDEDLEESDEDLEESDEDDSLDEAQLLNDPQALVLHRLRWDPRLIEIQERFYLKQLASSRQKVEALMAETATHKKSKDCKGDCVMMEEEERVTNEKDCVTMEETDQSPPEMGEDEFVTVQRRRKVPKTHTNNPSPPSNPSDFPPLGASPAAAPATAPAGAAAAAAAGFPRRPPAVSAPVGRVTAPAGRVSVASRFEGRRGWGARCVGSVATLAEAEAEAAEEAALEAALEAIAAMEARRDAVPGTAGRARNENGRRQKKKNNKFA